MSKKGFLKIIFYSIQGLKTKEQKCNVKAHSIDTVVSTLVGSIQSQALTQFYLPISDKIQIQVGSGSDKIGFFELPMKKIYENPTKKHIISINCITKDIKSNQINPEVFGVLKLGVMYFQNHVAKLDILIDRLQVPNHSEAKIEKQLFIQCIVGNVSSQTTLKKSENGLYQWKQVLPFTLQSIPGKIQLSIKDKDMNNDEVLGKITLDPQSQKFLESSNNKIDKKYEIQSEKGNFIINLSKIFKIPENQ